MIDPRAVRVAIAASSRPPDLAPMVVEPPAVPVAPAPHIAGLGVLGGVADPSGQLEAGDAAGVASAGVVLVDGEALVASLVRIDGTRARLDVDRRSPVEENGQEPGATRDGRHGILLGAAVPGSRPGTTEREVVVDGWRIVVEVESERRAALRERARRGHDEAVHGGPTEVRAIIPGRVVSVSIVPGDAVEAGQQLLVVEAMKMQNELRAPREGTVAQVAVAPGRNIEVGDLLLVLE
jgi:biotin carboxyl carrier protein